MNNSNKVIILLLLLNLAATIWFGSRNSVTAAVQKPVERALDHQLPSFIDDSVKADILNTFVGHFNDRNFQGLYDMFGAVAQAQISQQDMDREFAKLVKLFDHVKSGSFSYAELTGQQGSTLVYVLNYTVKLSEASDFGEIGELKVTIAIEGERYQIYGIRLNGST